MACLLYMEPDWWSIQPGCCVELCTGLQGTKDLLTLEQMTLQPKMWRLTVKLMLASISLYYWTVSSELQTPKTFAHQIMDPWAVGNAIYRSLTITQKHSQSIVLWRLYTKRGSSSEQVEIPLLDILEYISNQFIMCWYDADHSVASNMHPRRNFSQSWKWMWPSRLPNVEGFVSPYHLSMLRWGGPGPSRRCKPRKPAPLQHPLPPPATHLPLPAQCSCPCQPIGRPLG